MGYTHYWTPERREPADLPVDFAAGARAILSLAERHAPLTYNVTATCVLINGVDPDDCEDLDLSLDGRWSSCKTRALPYDLAVTALLALAAHHGLADVKSDGEPEDWAQGVALAREATGLDVQCPVQPRVLR